MEDNKNEKMDPSRELYEKLIGEVYKFKLEEREMALDRYRRADEDMDTPESFILMGKNAIDFLKQAASASDGIEKLAKEIKSIVYKDAGNDSSLDVSFNDAAKRSIIDAVKESEGEMPEEDLTDNDNLTDSED